MRRGCDWLSLFDLDGRAIGYQFIDNGHDLGMLFFLYLLDCFFILWGPQLGDNFSLLLVGLDLSEGDVELIKTQLDGHINNVAVLAELLFLSLRGFLLLLIAL